MVKFGYYTVPWHWNYIVSMGARRGEQGGAVAPPWKILKKKKKKKGLKKNVQTKFFNLQKAPIVCYAKNFPHKRPPCYALNTQKGPHVMR